ncbi:monovalent cation/H+ antiporter complex subunit F [Geodermatophilus marinus]|uniref:monovalent cation/H+ antiporter complex subunit F n=1 Tax=Geodermatophilus sp. LHW52908 TaxID=2303986 RepID=UPI000E3EDD29|nr:monovalent cation/H+ antiporter complex subunit F [Geodermatophilus sp. LHW52908]RFU22310.1 pH regulation protein F [Geodermatophilus sp. LHW52908]
MSVVAVVAFALLGAGALLCLVRVALGPSLLDRVVATETLLAIVTAGLAAHAALARDTTVAAVLLAVTLLGFTGAVGVSRYVGGMLVRSSDDGRDVGLPIAAEERASVERGAGADRR